MNENVTNSFTITDSAIDQEIMSRRKNRYNCACATLCGANAAARLGHDEETLKHYVAGFGGGIGGTHADGTCGALTGAVAGLGIFGKGDDPQTTAWARELISHFKQQLGAVQCNKLKSPELRVNCNQCCLTAGRKLMEILEREGIAQPTQEQ